MDIFIKYKEDAPNAPKGAVDIYTTPPATTGDVNVWRWYIEAVDEKHFAQKLFHRSAQGWECIGTLVVVEVDTKERYQRWLEKNVAYIEINQRRIFPEESENVLEKTSEAVDEELLGDIDAGFFTD